MRRVLAASAALMMIATPSSAVAQDMADVCASFEALDAGSWASYDIDAENQKGTMRMALLSQGAGGASGPWFELSATVNGQDVVMQMKVSEWPFDTGDIKELVVKGPGQPAMRVPSTMMGMMQSQMNVPGADIAEDCSTAELIGVETISVPAGSFEAYHIQPSDEEGFDVWVSGDLPFGIVKATGPEGSMTLTGSGADAMSSISEAPQDMPGMPGMGNQ